MTRFLTLLCILVSVSLYGQTTSFSPTNEFTVNYFYGSIIEHDTEIGHLITGRPSGILVSWNRKTFGKSHWSQHFNYPDQGLTVSYQDMANPHLGKVIGAYAHFNFYFFDRHLMLKVAQGLAYNTNPYNRRHNYRNNAYGTRFLSSSLLMANFVKKNLVAGLGFQTGLVLIHYSNGNFKAPNASTNSISANIGLNYLIDYKQERSFIPHKKTDGSEPIHLNLALRSGVNSSSVVGMGQYPFLTPAAYLDKRLGYTSSLLLGSEVFFSGMLKEFIRYRSIAFPEDGLTGHESSTRVGVFGGYELTINKFSLFVNLGYYIYYPYSYESRVYNRLGVKRKLTKHLFASFSVRSHSAKAENIALSIGYRL